MVFPAFNGGRFCLKEFRRCRQKTGDVLISRDFTKRFARWNLTPESAAAREN